MPSSPQDPFAALVRDYRKLVIKSASEEALEQSIGLLERAANVRIYADEVEAALRRVDEEERLQEGLPKRFSEHVLDFIQRELEESRIHRKRKLRLLQRQRLALRTVVAMSVPEFLERNASDLPPARYSIVVDSALIVFHQAYFSLLDALEPELSSERQLLLRSFMSFSSFLPYPDLCRIRALVFDALDQPEQAWRFYEEAVRKTPADSHEFMTVLQSAWSQLMENEWHLRAMSLLLDNAHRILKRDEQEFEQLALATLTLRRDSVRAAER